MLSHSRMLRWISVLGLAVVMTACGPASTPQVEPTTPPEPTSPPVAPQMLPATPTSRPTQTPKVETTPGSEQTAGVPTLPAAGQGTVVPGAATQPAGAATQPAGTTTQAAGAAPTQAAASANSGDKAEYVTQSIADGSQFRPGVKITVTWEVKNAGTNAWDNTYTLRNFIGPVDQNKTSVVFPKQTKPGETAKLTVTFTAPAQLGDYNSWWKLTNPSGQNFADVNLQFTVTNTPGAKVPTPTVAK